MGNIRQLKIYGKFSKRGNFQQKILPQINLSGNWLKDAGFHFGKQVFVKVENGRLIIDNEERRSQNG